MMIISIVTCSVEEMVKVKILTITGHEAQRTSTGIALPFHDLGT